MSCSSARVKCEERKTFEDLNVNSYQELLNYVGNEEEDIHLIVLDGRIITIEILQNLIFDINENKILRADSIVGVDGKSLDGEPKRVLILESNLCNSWKIIRKMKILKNRA